MIIDGIEYEEVTKEEFESNSTNPDYTDKWVGGNPDMWDIFEYTRANGVVPNVTVNGEGITDEVADKLVALCGAVACSIYDKNKSYDTVKKLTDRGMKQVNIHFVLSENTYDNALELLNDRMNDERLSKMNAIVFLSLKPKGRSIRNNYIPLSSLKFAHLVNLALEHKIPFGFDSCSQKYFLDSVKDSPNYAQFEQMAESCESSKFSIYADVNGDVYPCSFTPHTDGWNNGISLLTDNLDFLKDVWYEERIKKFRTKCIKCASDNQPCPLGLIH